MPWPVSLFLAYTVWYLIWRERYLARVGPCSVCAAVTGGPRCPVCGEPRRIL